MKIWRLLSCALLGALLCACGSGGEEKPVYEKPGIVVVVPLNSDGLEEWARKRGEPFLLDDDCAVIAVGQSAPVWIYDWLYVNRGKADAFLFLDWLARREGGDAAVWLAENGYPSIGEMRRWGEDNRDVVEAKLGHAEKLALSMDGAPASQKMKIFGGER